MMEQKLVETLKKGISTLFSIEVDAKRIILQATKKEFAGSYTFVTFPFAKQIKQAPPKIAEQLGEYLQAELEEVQGFNVVQGFLNIELTQAFWLSTFSDLVQKESCLLYTSPSPRDA